MSKRSGARRAAAVFASAFVGVVACGGGTPSPTSAADATQRSAEGTKAAAASFPADLTDVNALAAKLGTADAAFSFVRDQIAFEPYAGILKGAAGTLLTRGGNAYDRALLLAALVTAQGVKATVAHGQLPAEKAKQLFDQLVAAPDAFDLEAASMPTSPAPSKPDAASEVEKLIKKRAAREQQTLKDGYDDLTKELNGAKLPPATDSQAIIATLQDHFWVTTSGATNTTLDPSFRDANAGQTYGTNPSAVDPTSLPADAFSTIEFKLVAEYLQTDGSLTSTVALDTTARFADLVGQDIRFVMMPAGKDKAHPSAFVPALVVGDKKTKGHGVALHGGAAPPDSGGSPLGGFGGLANVAPPPPSSHSAGPPLGRVTLEIATHSPGIPDEKHHRIILDRVTGGSPAKLVAALADDATVPPLLYQLWQAVVSVGPLTPPFLLKADAVSQQAVALAERAGADFGKEGTVPPSSISSTLLHLLVTSDYVRQAIRSARAPHCRSFYRTGRLALFRHGPELLDPMRTAADTGYRETIDLVNAPIGFACESGDPEAVALESGVADATLELYARPEVATMSTIPLTRAAKAQSVPFFVATNADSLPAAAKSDPIAQRVFADAFSRGAIVVGASQPIALGGVRSFGWWEVGPGGSVVARAGWGGGQAMTETVGIEQWSAQVDEIMANALGDFAKCIGTGASMAFVVTPTIYGCKNFPCGPQTASSPQSPGQAADQIVGDCIIDAACGILASMAFSAADVQGPVGILAALGEENVTLRQLIKSGALGETKGQLSSGCSKMVKAAAN